MRHGSRGRIGPALVTAGFALLALGGVLGLLGLAAAELENPPQAAGWATAAFATAAIGTLAVVGGAIARATRGDDAAE